MDQPIIASARNLTGHEPNFAEIGARRLYTYARKNPEGDIIGKHHIEVERRRHLARWVAREILPQERAVRIWLSRAGATGDEADDLIQDAYCAFQTLAGTDHIETPAAYFLTTVRNLLIRRRRRGRIVSFVPLADLDAVLNDDTPSPERDVMGRVELAHVMNLLAALPERRRRIVEMRKLEGKSQRAVAAQLGISENIVEHEIRAGLAAIQAIWQQRDRSAATDAAASTPLSRTREQKP